MGLYDREYYREQSGRFSLGGEAVPTLIAINAVLLLVDQLFLQGRVADALALRSNLPTHPWQAWQLVTYGFVHADLGHVLFNMFALFMFGRGIEGIYGRAEFWRLYLWLIVAAGLGWVLVENVTAPGQRALVVGASGAVSGICVLYALHYPTRTFLFWGVIPVPAWLLVSMYVLQDLFGAASVASGRGGNVAYAAHLSGALMAYVYFRTGWSPARFWPSRWMNWASGLGRLGRGPRLQVHRPAEGDPHAPNEPSFSHEVDRILAKITSEGESSLTEAERRTLESASRRYQQRRR